MQLLCSPHVFSTGCEEHLQPSAEPLPHHSKRSGMSSGCRQNTLHCVFLNRRRTMLPKKNPVASEKQGEQLISGHCKLKSQHAH